jgi:hypothetical protein
MSLITKAEAKALLNIVSPANFTIVGSTSTGVIDITIDSTNLQVGDTLNATELDTNTLITSIISPTKIQVDKPAIGTNGISSITVSNRISKYDTMMDVYIPVVESIVIDYCNNDFTTYSSTPASIKMVLSKLLWLHINNPKAGSFGVTDESYDSISVSYGVDAYSKDIINLLDQHRFVEFADE